MIKLLNIPSISSSSAHNWCKSVRLNTAFMMSIKRSHVLKQACNFKANEFNIFGPPGILIYRCHDGLLRQLKIRYLALKLKAKPVQVLNTESGRVMNQSNPRSSQSAIETLLPLDVKVRSPIKTVDDGATPNSAVGHLNQNLTRYIELLHLMAEGVSMPNNGYGDGPGFDRLITFSRRCF